MGNSLDEQRNHSKAPIARTNSVVDSIKLGAFKGLTTPASYLKAIPNYFQKNVRSKHHPCGQSVVLKHDENELHIRRQGFENQLLVDWKGFTTVTDIFNECVKKFTHKHFVGAREIIHKEVTKTMDGKTITQLTLGHFQWESYGEIWTKIQCYCAFMRHLNFDTSTKIAIWADTCSDWMAVCLSLMYLKIPVVTVYSTLVDEAILHALSLTEVDAVFVDVKSLTRLTHLLPKLPSIGSVFLIGTFNTEDLQTIPNTIETPTLITVEREQRFAPKLSKKISRCQRISKTLANFPLFYTVDSDPKISPSLCEIRDPNSTSHYTDSVNHNNAHSPGDNEINLSTQDSPSQEHVNHSNKYDKSNELNVNETPKTSPIEEDKLKSPTEEDIIVDDKNTTNNEDVSNDVVEENNNANNNANISGECNEINKENIEHQESIVSKEINEGSKEINEGSKEINEESKEINEGSKEINEGSKEINEGSKEINEGSKEINDESKEINDESKEINEESKEINEGSKEINDESKEINEGSKEINDESKEINEGSKEINEGSKEINEESNVINEGSNASKEEKKESKVEMKEESSDEIPNKLKCYHISQLLIEGRQYLKKEPLEFETVNKDDLAIIMFTSGSTGIPKGVELQHKSVVASVGSASYEQLQWIDAIYPAFLPLAHIFEFVAEMTVAANGGAIGYCSPFTLTDTSPMVAAGTKGDLGELKPTMGTFVPLLLERIKKNVIDKVRQRSSFAYSVLNYSVNHARKMRSVSSDAPMVEKLAFSKIRSIIGGNFRWAVCGGAPLSPITQEFSIISFGFPIIQGYGLTETCAGGTLSNFNDFSVGNTGPPFYCAEIKLVPWLEGNYSPSDEPNPRGEIFIGGVCVARGYYKNEAATAESFFVDPETNQRWFKTGDIGEFCPNGTIKIIDRKKDIIKLKNGEYVSLVLVETIALQSQYIELCCALPNNNFDYVVLMVMPNRATIKSDIHRVNPEINLDTPIEDLIKDEKVRAIICDDIISYFSVSVHSKFEVPKTIVLVTDIWTPESGFLTPSMKIKRTEMKKFYWDILDHP